MKNYLKSLSLLMFLIALAPIPTLAAGEITVEQTDGDINIYSDVQISNTNDIVYFKEQEGNTTLIITKNECSKEGELLVRNKARMAGLFHSKKSQNMLKSKGAHSLCLSHISQASISI